MPRTTFTAVRTVLAASALVILAACSGGGAATSAPAATDGGAASGEQRTISAANMAFDLEGFTVPAGQAFTLQFNNNDSLPHNVAIYTDDSASEPIFQGEVIDGGESISYDVPALDAGEFYFQCDLHPEMNGTVTSE